MTKPFNKAADLALYLTDILSTIRMANGYRTDIGQKVFRGKLSKVDDDVPCSVIVEGNDTPGGSISRDAVKITQSYVFGGYVPCDPDNPNDAAHLVLKDLKRALFQDGPTMGGRVQKIEYQGRDIGPRPDGTAIVFAVVHVDISFAETLMDA